MPNWVSNTLRVKGEEEDLEDFRKTANKNKELSLATFIPPPKELEGTDSPGDPKKDKVKKLALKLKYGADNWYDWTIKNWGIKWDISDVNMLDEDEYEISYAFESPWSPPLEGLTKISKQFPDLVFLLQYEESGMGFIGIAKFTNGNMDDKSLDF